MSTKRKITVAHGDGIGPEIMAATLRILEKAGAALEYETIEIGEKVYLGGNASGINDSAWDSLRSTKVFLKAPITTPQGGGYKSLNVTTRKMLGLYSNVRPVQTLEPFVETKHHMDLVIVRENEEDLYAGIEHRQTADVVQCLKLITRPGSEKIIRYAFEYARVYGRKKVTCFTKDNIMKLTDGLFHHIFNEVGEEYPEIEKDHRIIDIGSALLADSPERFDIIVTENLYGDIISDIAAQVAGSVGLCGSANIGDQCAMFEAIHGSAPDIAGMDVANPSGLLNGAIMMLVHIQQPEVASLIQNAWLRTLEDGIHTKDINSVYTKQLVGTQGFADAVIERLGQKPQVFKEINYSTESNKEIHIVASNPPRPFKETVGVDIFLDCFGVNPNDLADAIKKFTLPELQLIMISNRGTRVWPDGLPETFLVDHWRCRIKAAHEPGKTVVTHDQILAQMKAFADNGYDVIKTENLCKFDGVKGYAAGQGEVTA
jgi:isocitrate dehydrogenase